VSIERFVRDVGADALIREELVDKIIGIDLGTTNSCAAVVVDGRPLVIPNAFGEQFTPSVVHVLENGEAVVGRDALLTQSLDPHNTITGIKRFIGRLSESILRPRLPKQLERRVDPLAERRVKPDIFVNSLLQPSADVQVGALLQNTAEQ
jgi:molecular chaperone DnaK (HSP70)